MILVIDLDDALRDFANAISPESLEDLDSFWYVADVFEMIVRTVLGSSINYSGALSGVVNKIAYETGEPRMLAQSVCDLAVTQILDKIADVFPDIIPGKLFADKKYSVNRYSRSIYTISAGT